MSRKFQFLVFVSSFSCIVAYSQSVAKGLVYDENETSLTGINISIKGTINGTITNLDGEFEIEASEGQIVQFHGHGIFRFLDCDIGNTPNYSAVGALFEGCSIRNFAIEQVNQKIYFSVITSYEDANDIRFYVVDPEGSNPTLIDDSLMMVKMN